MQIDRQELAQQVDQARWEWLLPHHQRDALIWVDGMLELAEVGERLAVDDAATVQAWLASRMIAKPSPDQLDEWNRQPGRQFDMLVVDPFVLIQEISE
jgi:hypothetical protein